MKKLSIKLSICIPTYNRANYLKEALESLISQVTEDIEIVISDNASTDNTKEIVRFYQQKFRQITYFCWDKNMGADRNYLRVIELAKGDYCWFLGSDDALYSGAICRILEEIQFGYDIYLINRLNCNIDLQSVNKGFWLLKRVNDKVFDLSDNSGLADYLTCSRSLGALFSYISSIVFKREKWNLVEFDNELIGTAYSHVFMLFSFISKGCKLKYLKNQLVLCRLGNDSFLDKGEVKRFLIDIDGYLLLGEKLFNNDDYIRKLFLKVLIHEHPWYRILKIRSIVDRSDWFSIQERLLKCGFNLWILRFCNTLSNFRILIRLSVYLKRKIQEIVQ